MGHPDIGVPNESRVVNVLDSHDSGECTVVGIFISVEFDAGRNLLLEVLAGHVRFSPPVGGDDAFVGMGAVVHDGMDGVEVFASTGTDHGSQMSAGRDAMQRRAMMARDL